MSYNFLLTQSNQKSLSMQLANLLLNHAEKPVFLCLGDSRFVADGFGPSVGSLLTNHYNIPYFVYGTLHNQVTKSNVEHHIKWIQTKHPQSPIVVIDAMLGDNESINTVYLKNGGVLCGSLDNRPILVGDISIGGITSNSGVESLMFLKSVTMENMLRLSSFTAMAINQAIKIYKTLTQPESIAKLPESISKTTNSTQHKATHNKYYQQMHIMPNYNLFIKNG